METNIKSMKVSLVFTKLMGIDINQRSVLSARKVGCRIRTWDGYGDDSVHMQPDDPLDRAAMGTVTHLA
jgi:hypothetical protein